jgi:adenine-specific DNA-methyltransferase
MTQAALNLPISLNSIVDSIREAANPKLDKGERSKLGQYMSTSAVSEILAGMFESFDGDIRLLDAGAGVGSLTAAFVNRAAQCCVTSIHSTSYELSDVLVGYLKKTLGLCEDKIHDVGANFQQRIITSDFIADSVDKLVGYDSLPTYNKVILNPPYLKFGVKSNERTLMRKVGVETGNLYSAFVSLAIKQLEKGGELVAITPRSFCNGPYFNDFRRLMLDECSLNKIHVFNCRKSAFKTDKVLQENVVYHLTKGEKQRDNVVVTSSSCAEDPNPTMFEIPFNEIVQANNPDRFIHIITNEQEREVANHAGGLPCSLGDLGIQASTGRVVDFRTRENLCSEFVDGSVPLIFPQHLRFCALTWPLHDAKKPNALLRNKNTENLMVPNGTYVVTRRLSAKEEPRRIIASIYTADIADVEVVGFENKTNYFHANGQPLDDLLARGLWVFLNSTLVDQYFRQMNGHTQVNATDLRTLRYPTRLQLNKIANEADFVNFSQERADAIINEILTIKESGTK